MNKRVRLGLIALGLLALPAAGFVLLRAQRGLSDAEGYIQAEMWPNARLALKRYLWLHPHDDQAHLRMAESLVRDDLLPSAESAPQAIEHLAQIPDNSPLGATARLQEGRLQFLVLHKPAAAEGLLRRAVILDPDALEAYYLLWKIYDLTGRSQLAEEWFWRVYELTDAAERPLRLREWYMSQFYPATSNVTLNRQMSFVAETDTPTIETEFWRFLRFRETEPDLSLPHAALARWFQLEGNPKQAKQLLDEASASLTAEQQNQPFFLATLIATLIDLGEFEQAEACFHRWPEPHEGYEYWKWRAIILDEVHGQDAEAVEAYNRALAIWPGPADWRSRTRKANCLNRLGDRTQAGVERAEAERIRDLMDEDVHVRLRNALGFLDQADKVREVEQFYEKLGREREANAWIQYLQELPQPRPPAGDHP